MTAIGCWKTEIVKVGEGGRLTQSHSAAFPGKPLGWRMLRKYLYYRIIPGSIGWSLNTHLSRPRSISLINTPDTY